MDNESQNKNAQLKTELNDIYELSPEEIMKGDKPEFQPVDSKERKDKDCRLYKADVVDGVVHATFHDLCNAYLLNQGLTEQINDLNKLASERINKDEAQLTDFSNNLDILVKKFNSVNQLSAGLNARFADLNTALATSDAKQKELQESMKALVAKIDAAETDKTNLIKERDEINDRLTSTSNELKNAHEEMKKLQEQLELCDGEKEELTKNVNDIIDVLNAKYNEFLRAVAVDMANKNGDETKPADETKTDDGSGADPKPDGLGVDPKLDGESGADPEPDGEPGDNPEENAEK